MNDSRPPGNAMRPRPGPARGGMAYHSNVKPYPPPNYPVKATGGPNHPGYGFNPQRNYMQSSNIQGYNGGGNFYGNNSQY